jgi:NAD(P)H-dependent flavin oxidoreductase YrpB (nitropropane dioxygenase family)
MLGAAGAWIGSAFLATEEAGIQDFQKQAIVDSDEEGTVVSRSVTGKPARLIRSKWTQAFADSGLEALPMPFQSMVSQPVLVAGMIGRRKDIVPGFAGQGIGMIKAAALRARRELQARKRRRRRATSARRGKALS